MDAGWHGDPGDSLRAAVEEHVRFLTSEDFKEGVEAFHAKRKPAFTGV